jgi:hypothetical protein
MTTDGRIAFEMIIAICHHEVSPASQSATQTIKQQLVASFNHDTTNTAYQTVDYAATSEWDTRTHISIYQHTYLSIYLI